MERAEVGIGQNMESKQASKGHSLAGEGRGWDWSAHGKQTSQQGTLTNWRGQRLGLVRTWKANKPARDTHILHQENPSFAFRAFSCFFVLFRAFYQKNRKSTKKPSPLLARLLSELVKKANPFPKAL